MLDRMRLNLVNGDESDIDGFLNELERNVKNFVEVTLEQEDIDEFDYDAVAKSQDELAHLEIQLHTIQDIAEQDYNIMAKRVKLKSLKQEKQSAQDIAQFNAINVQMQKQQYASSCLSYIGYVVDDCKKVLQ